MVGDKKREGEKLPCRGDVMPGVCYCMSTSTKQNKLYQPKQTIPAKTNYTSQNKLYQPKQTIPAKTIPAKTNYTSQNKLYQPKQTIPAKTNYTSQNKPNRIKYNNIKSNS
jgi:hypothetical protein